MKKKEDENLERRKQILAEMEELDKKISSEDCCLEDYDRYWKLREELFSLLPRETELNRIRRQTHQACTDGGFKFLMWFSLILCVFMFFGGWYSLYDVFGRNYPEVGITEMVISIVIGSFLLWILTYPKDDGII